MMLIVVLTVLKVKRAQDHSYISIVLVSFMFVHKWLSLIWLCYFSIKSITKIALSFLKKYLFTYLFGCAGTQDC